MTEEKAKSALPKHIAIVMDGNGRWAKQRQLARTAGHQAGVESARELIEACVDKGIETLSLFAFSSENWHRPTEEIDTLMRLFLISLNREVNKLHESKVQLRFIGDIARFNDKLQKSIRHAEGLTKNNTGLKLIIAVNYGGRWDMMQSCRKLAQQVLDGKLKVEDISSDNFNLFLSTADLPEPDLFIRTSGEKRISNFFLWQLAYTELYFTDVLWPDFRKDTFNAALADFANRQRRFGKTAEQIVA